MLPCLSSFSRAGRRVLAGFGLALLPVVAVRAQSAPPSAAGRPFVRPVPSVSGGPGGAGGAGGAGAAVKGRTEPEYVRLVARELAGLGATDELRATRVETDARGNRHARYQQIARGIPVEHGVLTAHYRAAELVSLSGELKTPTGPSATPALTEDVARERALTAVGARRYLWQRAGEAPASRGQTGDLAATELPSGTLVWVEDFLAPPTGAARAVVLAWKFDIYATEPLSREWVYVDALTGRIVLRDAILKHAAAESASGGRGVQGARGDRRVVARPATAVATPATATFATRYSGSRVSQTDAFNGRFRLRDSTRGGGIVTYNMRRGTDRAAAVDFTDADNNWTAAEHANANKDNAALDAHWGTQVTYDYFRQRHNRRSFDGADARLESYVHYGRNIDNAFWDGWRMVYCDGDRQFTPLTALDVVGHEVGHAVCQYTAHLVYYDQSAALNEGLSDIWGACVEHFGDSTKNIWDIGDQIALNNPNGIRSLRDPKLTYCPDTYRGQYYFVHRFAEPHTNSTVLSHWFYLLSQGGTGTNDLGRSYAVAGIGIRRAAQIVYHLESAYLTPTSTYPDAWRGALAAAADLYGENSPEELAVARAWYAVGVGDALPVLAAVQPTQGPVGAWLLLQGQGLGLTRQVVFGGNTSASEFAVVDSAHVQVRVPEGAVTGNIRLTTPLGSATSGAEFVVTSQGAAPRITGFAPAAGQRVGGTVTITGQNLTGAATVRFGGVEALVAAGQSATQLTVVIPPQAVTGALEVEAPGGVATAPTVCRVLPILTGFSPTSGPAGTFVTLTGTGLTGALGATIADSAARLLLGGSAGAVTITVPVGSPGGPVRLTTAGGTAVAPGVFTLTASPAPTVTGFAPPSGGPNVTVRLTGTGLAGATAVAFSGAAGTPWLAAVRFAAESDSVLAAVVPLLVATGPIQVTTRGGTAITATAFRATGPACRLSAAIDGGAGPGAAVCAVPGAAVRLRTLVLPGSGALTPSYSASPLPYAPHPEPTNPGPTTNFQVVSGVPIGFTFQFFGRSYTSFNLSSSGNIQFSSRDYAGDYYAPVPHTYAPQNFISLAWRAWNPANSGRVTYGLEGTAPNRCVVISYFQVPYLMDVTTKLTAQLVLHETTNYIDFIYTDTGKPAYMSTGAENSSGTVGTPLPGKSSLAVWRAEREAWRLTPISVAAPLTYTWTPAPGLGVTTGPEAVLSAPAVPTTYTVTVRDGLCARPVTLTVTPAPALPAAAPVIRCGPGSVTLRATGAPTGGSYAWYDAPAGGAPLTGATGPSFTTPVLTGTTTYYVAAVSAGGCAGTVRTARTALIASPASIPGLTAPATVRLGQAATLAVVWPQPGVQYRWTGPGLPAGGTSGVRISATATSGGPAVYTATATTPGCGAAVAGTVTVVVTAAPVAPAWLGFTPTSGSVGSLVEVSGLALNGVTGVRFVGGTAGGGGVIAPILAGRTAVRLLVRVPAGAQQGPLTLLWTAGATTSADRFCVQLVPAAATGARCGPGSVVLTASGAPGGAFYRWYGQAVDGEALATTANTSFSTPAIASTRQFFVSIVVGTGADECEGLRTAAVATVKYVPRPTIGADGPLTFCRGRAVRLYAGGSTEAHWNTGETGFSIIVDSAGTYWFTGTIYDSCPVRSDSATVVVTDPPVATFRYDTIAYCAGGVAPVLSLTGTSGGRFSVTPRGLALDSLTGAVQLSASAPGAYRVTYAVRTACPDTARHTQILRVVATPVVTLTAGGPTTFCAGDSVTLMAGGGGPYQWSTGATTAVITVRASGAYTVQVAAAGCVATAPPITVTTLARPPVPVISQTTPAGGGVLLTSSAASGNQWYHNGAPLAGATASTLLLTTPGTSGSYAVVATAATGCASAPSAAVSVIVTATADALGSAAWALWPNPAHGQARVTGAGPRVALALYDVTGRCVRATMTDATGAATLDLTGVARGVYAVRANGRIRRLVVE